MKIASLLTAVLVAAFGATAALAQYPAKPIRVVVPFPPGSATDITDVVGGRVQVMWATPTTGLAHVKEGKLRALVTSLKAR